MADVVRHFPLTALTCVGLLLFLAVFLGVLVKTFLLLSNEKTRGLSLLALDEGDRLKLDADAGKGI